MLRSDRYCDRCGAGNRATARFCIGCGAARAGRAAQTGLLAPGSQLSARYRILRKVGQGGMGAVYEAEDPFNRHVAMKEMSQGGLTPQERAQSEAAFALEGKLLAHLQHAHLPGVYDAFSEAGHSYLVMEFIEGETLEAYVGRVGTVLDPGALDGQNPARGRALPLDTVLAFGIQLCDVLDYLHARTPPIIFRDLKPANVMRRGDGELFLIDFGIARLFVPGQGRDTTALGSPGYASPEQHGGAQTDARSDLYSLGVLLHALLTGADPSLQPFFFAPASRLNPEVPADVEALLRTMVEFAPDRRPGSASEVGASLRVLLAGRAAGAAPAPGQVPVLSASPLAQPAAGKQACLFFVPDHSGACLYSERRWKEAGPLVDDLRRQVVYGKPVRAQLEAVEESLRKAPSLGLWMSPSYVRCKGAVSKRYDYVARPEVQCTCDAYRPASTPDGQSLIDDLRALAAGTSAAGSSTPTPAPAPVGQPKSVPAKKGPRSGSRPAKTRGGSISVISAVMFAEEDGRSFPQDQQLVAELREACAGIASLASARGTSFVYRDTLGEQTGGRTRDLYEQYISEATVVLIVFTPALLASARACSLVELALDISFECAGQGQDLIVIPVIGVACDWQKKFPALGPTRNRVLAPVDGRPLYYRPDRAKQLQKIGRDLGDLLFPHA